MAVSMAASKRARDVMQEDVVTVSPELPLLDVHELFVSDEIHGAPVVDEDGKVVGIITSADLLRAVADVHAGVGVEARYLRDLVEFSSPDWIPQPGDFQDRLRTVFVRDVMTTSVVQVGPDAPISEVARAICQNRVHRVLVTDAGRLVGIISTFDLVSVLRNG